MSDSLGNSVAKYFRFLYDFMRELFRIRNVMMVFAFHGGSQGKMLGNSKVQLF